MRAKNIRFGVTACVITALAASATADAQQYSITRLCASQDFANNLLLGASIINSAGQVIGNCDSGRAQLYSHGKVRTIPTLSAKYPIPVGASSIFLYSNGQMMDLNTLVAGSKLAKSLVVDDGVAINDDGWIVAEGVSRRTGVTYELLLKPERASP